MNKPANRKSQYRSALVACCFLAFCMFSAADAVRSDSKLQWPTPNATAMPFRPHDKMICQQNPPDFSWPKISKASRYHLQIARTLEFSQVAYEKADLAVNFYNFPAAFPAGIWYWRVRFQRDASWSPWTVPRRFRIGTDAWLFPVPAVDSLLARVPQTHPRIWTTAKDLAAFRARAQGPGKIWMADYEVAVRKTLNNLLPTEPAFAFSPDGPKTAEWIAAQLRLRGQGEGAARRLRQTAFLYLATGDEAVGRSAVKQLLNLAAWDPAGATGYKTHDQVHRAIAFESATAYDWCYNLLTPAERDRVRAMVLTRARVMFQQLVSDRPLTSTPHDSHGWTALGLSGIVSVAFAHEATEGDAWFRQIVPVYINLLPPWGDEDGGWCQGVDYWQYSQEFNREFMDVLWFATGFSLYDKAWAHNNAYFPLYAFPHGTPRTHFGDGGEAVASYRADHYMRNAQIYRDGVLRWGREALGESEARPLSLADYLGNPDLPATPPANLPRARWFRDIDWVCLHSDLTDANRVSFYFKASPLASQSHSHADQNSFVLNAYGETLALDSGYYDWYLSPHDKNYTKQTLAHNAVTHDGGFGQPYGDATASGRILGFATSERLDACTGDATPAYKGALQRAVRHIIFLRPDIFVIVDDLAAAPGKTSSFEWWLHALKTIRLDADQAGATVEQGQARLRVRLHSPWSLTACERTEFIGPPNVYPAGQKLSAIRPANQLANKPDQVHAWFATPPAQQAQIIATLEVYRDGGPQPSLPVVERGLEVTRLRFGNGAKLAVRTSSQGVVRFDDMSFNGAAAAVSGNAVLLLGGTMLERNNSPIITADKPITAVIGGNDFTISCTDDTCVQVRIPGKLHISDARGRELPREQLEMHGDIAVLRLEPSYYTLRFK